MVWKPFKAAPPQTNRQDTHTHIIDLFQTPLLLHRRRKWRNNNNNNKRRTESADRQMDGQKYLNDTLVCCECFVHRVSQAELLLKLEKVVDHHPLTKFSQDSQSSVNRRLFGWRCFLSFGSIELYIRTHFANFFFWKSIQKRMLVSFVAIAIDVVVFHSINKAIFVHTPEPLSLDASPQHMWTNNLPRNNP